MKTTFVVGMVMAGLVFVCSGIGLLFSFRKWGYRDGVEEGRKLGEAEGRVRADNWWMGTERQVDEEQKEIRRRRASFQDLDEERWP